MLKNNLKIAGSKEKKSLKVEKINIFQTLFHNVCGHTEKKSVSM